MSGPQFLGCRERVQVVDVELVDRLVAVRSYGHRDLAAVSQGAVDKRLAVVVGEETLGRTQPDAVVAGEKVKPGRGRAHRADAGSPRAQLGRAARHESVQDKGWQRELIDQVGLVLAVAEVGDVLGVRHVGLGEQLGFGRDVRREPLAKA